MKFFPAAFNRIARALDVLWGTPTNGQVFTYDSSLQKAKWANGGSGDMTKATYDTNNDGIVDNAAALGGTSAATITSSIAAKLPLAGGTMAGSINLGNSSLFDVAQLALIDQKTGGGGTTIYFRLNSDTDGYPKALRVDDGGSLIGAIWGEWNDGAGSGMDADLLDGQHGSYYRDAANLNAGTVPTARLGSGVADNTTYLRGDQTWATVSAGVGGSLGAVDNAIPRADGTGGSTLQASDLSILDASTSTANNVAITNIHAGQTNSSLVASPKGTGAFIVGPRPDGTITGGNARGAYAFDGQIQRATASQVASGANAALFGARCTASGQYSFAAGYTSTASGTLAVALGDSATASHDRSFVVGLDSSSGVSSDRVEQFKIKGDGGLSQQTAGGTYTIWGKVSSDPVTGIQAGDLYYNTTTNKMRCYNGTTWNDLF